MKSDYVYLLNYINTTSIYYSPSKIVSCRLSGQVQGLLDFQEMRFRKWFLGVTQQRDTTIEGEKKYIDLKSHFFGLAEH